MKKRAAVIGAGWAGMAAACYLADAGFQVTLLESTGILGGRARSFHDKTTGDLVDNGQHLLMGCYRQTRRFLNLIGSDAVEFIPNLTLDFFDRQGQLSRLKNCRWLPAPLDLLAGILGLSHLNLQDKIGMLRVGLAARRQCEADIEHLTARQWLTQLGQSEKSQKYFWDLIILATLNETPERASAAPFVTVLREAFFSGRGNSDLGVARVGLSEVCGPQTEAFLKARGGEVRRFSLVQSIVTQNGRVQSLRLQNGESVEADIYVSAVPFFALKNILPADVRANPFFAQIQNLQTAPIVSVNLWFDAAVTLPTIAGLLDTEFHWAFQKSQIWPDSQQNYVTLVASGARELTGKSDEEIVALAKKELADTLPQTRNLKLRHSLVVREKNATLSPTPGTEALRPSSGTPIANLFLCGDWTATGLPATLESAVQSAEGVVHAIRKLTGGGRFDKNCPT